MTRDLNFTCHYPALPGSLLERVLIRLGFRDYPKPTFAELRTLYAAWCQRVPFDNVQKLIHVRFGKPGPLPGRGPADFFEAWLKHGTGGTCWAGAGALHALLETLGFEASRGIATMLVRPDLPPNHGTVQVRFGHRRYLVDNSILHAEPLSLLDSVGTEIQHPAWGIRCQQRDAHWHITWRPLNHLDGLECRLDRFAATQIEFQDFYDQTSGWSPFNFELTARVNRGQCVVGVTSGHRVVLAEDGTVSRTPLTREERLRVLIDEFRFSDEIAHRLPADVPTPPPPWSQTAQQLRDSAVAAA